MYLLGFLARRYPFRQHAVNIFLGWRPSFAAKQHSSCYGEAARKLLVLFAIPVRLR